ncbi:MAG TPA: AraC family transcriptional regulator [Planctomycetota bacterium]|nr:AraC family transcriptional regulator [Planctomycetota bacterium]
MAPVPVVDIFARGRGTTAAHVHCTAGRHDRPFVEQHTQPSLAVVRRGFFTYHRDGRAHALGPGFVLLGNAGDDFVCSHELGSGDDCTSFSFEPDALEDVVGGVARHSGRRPFEAAFAPPDPRVGALLRDLAAGEVAAHEVALSLAAVVLEAGRPSAVRSTRQTRERIACACRFLDEHAAEEVSLDAVAAEVGLSPFHFLRTFRAEVGMTPHQYVIGARLARAVALLRDTSLSVTRVALDAGFGDVSNFINTFRRRLGASPGVFRRSGRFTAPGAAKRPERRRRF